jgi:WD40 repeat-containing protein SMU1
LELLELREVEVARAMLRQTELMLSMKQEQPGTNISLPELRFVLIRSIFPERYLRLEHLCSRPIWDAREAYEGGSNKESRRVEIAKLLSTEVGMIEFLADYIKFI